MKKTPKYLDEWNKRVESGIFNCFENFDLGPVFSDKCLTIVSVSLPPKYVVCWAQRYSSNKMNIIDDRQGTDAPQIMPSQIPDNIEELIELSCNDQVPIFVICHSQKIAVLFRNLIPIWI